MACMSVLLLAVLQPAGHAAEAGAPTAQPGAAGGQGLSALPIGWSTFLGGAGDNQSSLIATDSQGNIYATGSTTSTDFPVTPGAVQPRAAGHKDAFVTSYSATGRLRWATYLGGSGDDYGYGVATDVQGNVYAVGDTASANFPVTTGAAQAKHHRGNDAFVASYTSAGQLRWATYLGGSGDDSAAGVVTDSQGNVSVTGYTASTDFPVTAGAVQLHNAGGYGGFDAFVASFTAQGQLRWATYLGGSQDDYGTAIAADSQGNLAITGVSLGDFPVTPDAAQTEHVHDSHVSGTLNDTAIVASFSPEGKLRWATFLGGSSGDDGAGVAVDGQGNLYVTGNTDSQGDFPVTDTASQTNIGGGTDAFVVSYTAQGKLRWATYLGGSAGDFGSAIAVDATGLVYVTGATASPNFPITEGDIHPKHGQVSGAFVAAYSSLGTLSWASYLGGTNTDNGTGIATDSQGDVLIAGTTSSPDFPIMAGGAQARFSGGHTNVFIARLIASAIRPAALSPVNQPTTVVPHSRYFSSTRHTLADPYFSLWNQLGGTPTLGLPLSEPFDLAGTHVQVTERAVLIRSGNTVHVAPLGRLLSAGHSSAVVSSFPTSATRRYFPSTGHSLSGRFLAYWRTHQGNSLLGPPIAEPGQEVNDDGSGQVYLVQWFVNGRLEYHPEAHGAAYQVQPGRVGYEFLHRLGLL
jgi:Beta-propeller repeat